MKKVILLVLALLSLSGCYYKRVVDESEVGLVMTDGVKVDQVVYAGRYTDMSYYAEMVEIDVSGISAVWADPDLVTKDKQPIGIELALSFARNRTAESIMNMYQKYKSEALNNDALTDLVLSRVPGVAKAITTQYSLDEMLGIGGDIGRAQVEDDLFELLNGKLSELGVELRSVSIKNIAPAESYMALLQEKSNARIEVEVAQEKTKMLAEKLLQETAQTDIDLEVARRENLVAEEKAKVFEESDRVYELERLRLLANVLGDTDKVYFIPEGTDITLYIGAQPLQK